MQSELSLFVYGSFSEGMVHFDQVSQYIVAKESAFAQGSVYRLQVGYPVYLKDGQDRVPGQVLKLQAPDLVFKLLDEFHGYAPLTPDKSLFFKEGIQVQTGRGEELEVSVYTFNPTKLPKTASRIHGGNWEENFKLYPSMISSLTDRQTLYVKRLSTCSGREIVPIDLDLYRELMKLDLIVDKGRRLALSKFGKEVARFLS